MDCIIRHRKENVAKCSLRGLEDRFLFLEYPKCTKDIDALSLEKYIVLDMDAPVLSSSDTGPILLIDATWKYAQVMHKQLPLHLCVHRSIPSTWKTAYPRKQTGCADPERGLASIEALFVAFHILGRSTAGLLDHYFWKNDFLAKNSFFIECIDQ